MELERKALYNYLKMQWLQCPDLNVLPWQVEDLRAAKTEKLFSDLTDLGIVMDKTHFLAWVERSESPEELSEYLTLDDGIDPEMQDQIYLLLFELWRRLTPEKQTLSLFCDELDTEISLFEAGDGGNGEGIQDALAKLQAFFEECLDAGMSREATMKLLENNLANSLESFLYAYIRDQIDQQQFDYAGELLDSFEPFASDEKWFTFLRSRLLSHSDPEKADDMLRHLVERARKMPDLEFHFELLEHLAGQGHPSYFLTLAKYTLALLEMEDDLQELLSLCLNYYARLDRDREAQTLQQLLNKRQHKSLRVPIDPLDVTLCQVTHLLQKL